MTGARAWTMAVGICAGCPAESSEGESPQPSTSSGPVSAEDGGEGRDVDDDDDDDGTTEAADSEGSSGDPADSGSDDAGGASSTGPSGSSSGAVETTGGAQACTVEAGQVYGPCVDFQCEGELVCRLIPELDPEGQCLPPDCGSDADCPSLGCDVIPRCLLAGGTDGTGNRCGLDCSATPDGCPVGTACVEGNGADWCFGA